MRSLIVIGSLIGCLALEGPASAQSDFADFWGAWGMQSGNDSNAWERNCAENRALLVVTPSRIYTRGATSVYKEHTDCKVLNGSGGAQLLINAYCSSHEDNAESVMLEFTILGEPGSTRIQRRGQVGTEYRKCNEPP